MFSFSFVFSLDESRVWVYPGFSCSDFVADSCYSDYSSWPVSLSNLNGVSQTNPFLSGPIVQSDFTTYYVRSSLRSPNYHVEYFSFPVQQGLTIDAVKYDFCVRVNPSDVSSCLSKITEINSYSGSGVGTAFSNYRCSDGSDNDGDGLVDLSDLGCSGSGDDFEYNVLSSNFCSGVVEDRSWVRASNIVDYSNPKNCFGTWGGSFWYSNISGVVNLGKCGYRCNVASSYLWSDDPYALLSKIGQNPSPELGVSLEDYCISHGANPSAPIVPYYALTYYSTVSTCSDGLDNDFDGFVDSFDSGCKDANGVYQSSYDSELRKCYNPAPSCTTVGFDPARIYYPVSSVCSSNNLCTSPSPMTQVCPSSTDSCKIPSCSGGTCSFVNVANGITCTPSSGKTSDCFNSSTRRVFSFSCSSGSCFSSGSTLSNCPSGQSCVFNTVTNTSSCVQACLTSGSCDPRKTLAQNNICNTFWCSPISYSSGKICSDGATWDANSNLCRIANVCDPDPCNLSSFGFLSQSYYSTNSCFINLASQSCCSVTYGNTTTSDWLSYQFVNASSIISE